MTINFQLPKKASLKPQISVFGVGGAGCNAVNNMINASLEGVNFIVANTDAQAIENSLTEKRIQLGVNITQGLGAGSYPEVGRAAAEESLDEIIDHIQGSHMVFITAGMGGGTGTGAAPVVARAAKEMGILTVAVVTKPFHFEGTHRMRVAELGLQELQKFVDTFIVIPNQNLFRVADKKTTFADAFKMADDVLHSGVRSVTDLMVMPGLINLDFADVRSVMSGMGKAMMGTGEATGDKRSIEAAEAAIANPLLDHVSMQGAKGVLINITGGPDMTLFEVDEAANRIRDEVDADANIIFGSTFSQSLEGTIRVSVVATGIDSDGDRKLKPAKEMFDFKNQQNLEQHEPEKISIASRPEFIKEEAREKFTEETKIEEQFVEISYTAPEPVEPEAEPDEQVVFSSHYVEETVVTKPVSAPKTEIKQPSAISKTFGFFKSSPKNQVVEERPAPSITKKETFFEKNHLDEDRNLFSAVEDELDVPAFMRRKK